MSYLEAEAVREAYLARLQIVSSLAGAMLDKDPKKAIEFPKPTLDAYLGLTLPYQFKKTKIKKTFSSKDLKQISEMLIKKNQQLANAART